MRWVGILMGLHSFLSTKSNDVFSICCCCCCCWWYLFHSFNPYLRNKLKISKTLHPPEWACRTVIVIVKNTHCPFPSWDCSSNNELILSLLNWPKEFQFAHKSIVNHLFLSLSRPTHSESIGEASTTLCMSGNGMFHADGNLFHYKSCCLSVRAPPFYALQREWS